MIISARLREERERIGLSQEDFGKKGGVSRRSQNLYESEASERSPDGDYYEAIAKAGADVQYIITGHKKVAESAAVYQVKQAGLSSEEYSQLLEEVAQAVRVLEGALIEQNKTMTPESKGEMVSVLVDWIHKAEGQVEPAQIIRLLKAAGA